MKLLLLKKYKNLYFQKKSSRNMWLINGIAKIIEFYSRFDVTLVIDKSSKSDSPIFCSSDNSICSGVVYIDPDRAFKADYIDTNFTTVARKHCENIKNSNLSKNDKRYLDFVLGVCHEIGHIKKQHGTYIDNDKYLNDIKYKQKIEIEAEEEVVFRSQQMTINNQKVFNIIEPNL
jgi:hypothetical protein